MKKVLLALLLGSYLGGYAQNTITETDDFDKAENGWTARNSKEASATFQNGKMIIKRINPIGAWQYGKHWFFDSEKDFSIEADLTLSQCSDKKGYGGGLVWGMEDPTSFFGLIINPGQRFLIYKFDHGEYAEIKSWSKTEDIKGLGQNNNIKLEKTGSTIKCSINGTEVHSFPAGHFFGPQIGFGFLRDATMQVDKLSITHEKEAINEVPNAKHGYTKINLGKSINTAYHEFAPAIAPDGKTLYFSRYNHPENTGDGKYDDIWAANLKPDGSWSQATNVGTPLNNDIENSVLSTMPDGNMLLLLGKYDKNGRYAGMGLSLSYRENGVWSMPEAMKIKGFDLRGSTLSACLSFDEKILIVSMKSPGGQGGTDLYVSFLEDDGTWSQPKNLGAGVNSKFRDETPFLAGDDRTLYFSTNGRPGYGNGDLFMTKRMDDTWTNWSEPQNLGPEVNSEEWDAYYSMPASGNVAYCVSRKNAIGNSDIFKIQVGEESQPDPVALVKGVVYNSKTDEVLGAKITYHELASDKELGIAHSNGQTGAYEIVLPYGKKYSFFAEKEGFYSVRQNIDETNLQEYQELEVNLYLAPLEVGQKIQINNIFFVRGQPNLLEESYPELDKLIEMMLKTPSLEIDIEGHTDNQGSAGLNLELSENRVQTVKDYLISKGISKKRITGKGYGGSRPIADNRQEFTRKLNRRVEFKITKF